MCVDCVCAYVLCVCVGEKVGRSNAGEGEH